MLSLFVVAALRVATPCATAPKSCLCLIVHPVGLLAESGSASAYANQTRVLLPSVAPAVNAGDNTLVSAVPELALVWEAPMGVVESNSPAGTRMTVAVQDSEALGVNVRVPAVQLPVAFVYHA